MPSSFAFMLKSSFRLARIDCDSLQSGSLDSHGFVRGMWMIDEELRALQHARP